MNTLRTIRDREDAYREVNNQIRDIQGDFPSYVQCVDSAVLSSLFTMLDRVLCGNASYFLWEVDEGCGNITHDDGTEHPIKAIEDVEVYARKFSPYAKDCACK
jgi:hypothetical protein